MSGTYANLIADKAYRDAARKLVEQDVASLSFEYRTTGLAERATRRFKRTASDIGEEAVNLAAEHPALLTGLVLALIGWLLRDPLISALTGKTEEHEDDAD